MRPSVLCQEPNATAKSILSEPSAPPAAIRVRGLTKSYGTLEALKGVDLEVAAGEMFALLGPNAAGKTTMVEIMEGYREQTAGQVEVLAADPQTAGADWRARVGMVLQECRLDPELTASEILELFAGYYPHPLEVEELLELVGLSTQRGQRIGRLSGGQRRRLDVALALVGDPELLFLDEPTTGFDPAARREFWRLIRGLWAGGKTVFLTTHYMEEAEALAERVAIIVDGRIVAEGPPLALAQEEAFSTIRFSLPPGAGLAELPAPLQPLVERDRARVIIRTEEPVNTLNRLTSWALEGGHALPDLEVSRPSLEDVYLRLTGAPPEEKK